jgi:hypothetical protein
MQQRIHTRIAPYNNRVILYSFSMYRVLYWSTPEYSYSCTILLVDYSGVLHILRWSTGTFSTALCAITVGNDVNEGNAFRRRSSHFLQNACRDSQHSKLMAVMRRQGHNGSQSQNVGADVYSAF